MVLVFALARCSSRQTSAQEPSSSPPNLPIQVTTDLVTVRAVFFDAHGKRVTNLSADEIVVKDRGEPQTLVVFEPPRPLQGTEVLGGLGGAQLEGTRRDSGPPEGRFHVLILIPGMRFADRHYALQAAAKYLQQPHGSQTAVAVADATGATLSFTSSQKEMTEFGRALLKLPMPSAGWFGSRKYRQTSAALCHSLKEREGRKAIVFFTDYYRTENNAIVLQQPDDVMPLALDANAAIYPVDARGVQPEIPFGDASSAGVPADVSAWSFANLEEMNDLTGLAVETGGSYAVGNDLGSAFQRATEDASSSYVLAYYKRNLRLDGGFHPINVQCTRHSVRVQAKSGYFARVDGIRDLAPDNQLKMLLASERPFDDISIRLKPYFFPFRREGEDSVVAVLGMRFEWMPSGADSDRAKSLSVLGVVRGPEDKRERILYDGPLDSASENDVDDFAVWRASAISQPIQLSRGDTAIKVAARSGTGELGNAFLEFSLAEQPQPGLRLSSLVIARRMESVPLNRQESDSPDPLCIGNERIVPEASSQFAGGEDLLFYARVGGAEESVPLTATLSFQNQSGEKIFRPLTMDLSRKEEASSFGIPVLFKLPASGFKPKDGPFVAILAVKQNGSKVVKNASAAFLVVPEGEP